VPTGITVLIYHRVGSGDGSQMDVSPATFDRQMAWLAASARPLSLDAALSEIASGDPTDGVVVTFDDGTTDWVDTVLPILRRHHVPATFYVTSGFVDGSVELPANGRPISWAGLQELAADDLVTIGAHTHGHRLLDRLAASEIATELDRNVELLAHHTGVEARHFAYPKAVAGSAAARDAVAARFDSAALAGGRVNSGGHDPFALGRTPIQASDGMSWFTRKARGGLGAEERLRESLGRVRYRGRTT
jgi:peptidoglycan/xylan/chitin deacetylase (PgdA/CDA1 family)